MATPSYSERSVGDILPAMATKQMNFRMPPELIARLDRYVERLRREHQGVIWTRTNALRRLLSRALDQEEAKKAGKKR